MQPNNPTPENQPQFELPQYGDGLEKLRQKGMEKRPDLESASGKSQPATTDDSQSLPDLSIIQAPAAVLPADDSVKAAPASPPIDAGDRIDKEWVDRAKNIIANTRDDPHEQKKEISKVKAEYIHRRFGKVVPTDDTVTA